MIGASPARAVAAANRARRRVGWWLGLALLAGLAGCMGRIGGGTEGGGAGDGGANSGGADGGADPCAGVTCGEHGSCVSSPGVVRCDCDPGYHDSGQVCVPDDPCAGVTCSDHGSCVDDGGAARCDCDPDYQPSALECVPEEVALETILGVYAGNDPQAILDFEAWLGRPAGGVLGYIGQASWADWDGCVGWAIGLWSAIDRPVLWSVPLIPWGATLAEAASGAYNADHYLPAAEKLAATRPMDPVIHVRMGWEFNGGWFADGCTSEACAPDYIGAWRQFVDTFRSVSPRFRFTWCPNDELHPFPLELAYPGDDYVDVIGLDTYDWGNSWEYEQTVPYGMNWLRDFAAERGKPVAIPEWGVGKFGDNPEVVQHLHDWCQANQCVYQTYWDSDADYNGKLSAGQHPEAGARYRALFGAP